MTAAKALAKDARAWVAALLLALGVWLFATAPAASEWRGIYWPLGATLVLAGVPYLLTALSDREQGRTKHREDLDNTRLVCLLALGTRGLGGVGPALTAIHALTFHTGTLNPQYAAGLILYVRSHGADGDLTQQALKVGVNRICSELGQPPLYEEIGDLPGLAQRRPGRGGTRDGDAAVT